MSSLIRIAVGATAGLCLVGFFIYREVRRRRSKEQLQLRPGGGRQQEARAVRDAEVAAQQQAAAAVEAVMQGLPPQRQLEVRNQLEQVLSCVASLRSEVAELRGGLQDIAQQIIQDVRKGVEDSQRARRRRCLVHRERGDSTSSSSIYFSATQGVANTDDGETSEGGYSTAYADSDYNDRDTDRDEADPKPEPESEEDEDVSCVTVLTLRQEDSPEEEGEEEEEEEEGRIQSVNDVPGRKLVLPVAL